MVGSWIDRQPHVYGRWIRGCLETRDRGDDVDLGDSAVGAAVEGPDRHSPECATRLGESVGCVARDQHRTGDHLVYTSAEVIPGSDGTATNSGEINTSLV